MHSEPFFDALSGIKGKSLRAVGSAPTGQRALLVAITYSSTPWAKTPQRLFQPQHDVQLMKEYLLKYTGFSQSDITVLTDTEGTPKHRLPTYINIMREMQRLGTSSCQNVFFLYRGRSDQRPQPNKPTQERRMPKSALGQRVPEKFDQFIIPIDAVVGPNLEDINPDHIIRDVVLQERLVASLPGQSTFLAIMDAYHGDLGNTDAFNFSYFCNDLRHRRPKLSCPIAVTISHQRAHEAGRSLTEKIVQQLRDELATGLRDVIDSVLDDIKLQQELMKDMEKRYKKAGDRLRAREMYEMRRVTQRLMPQVASTRALGLSRFHRWLAWLTLRSDD